MLVNEATPNQEITRLLQESQITKEDDDLKLSNQMMSMSNLQSFNDNFVSNDSIAKQNSRLELQLPDSSFQNTISITFTSVMTYKNFQIMRNQFLLIFKVTFPDEFFKNVYDKKYFTIFGMDKGSKELICFAVIDINQVERSADILALGVVKEYQNKRIGSAILKKTLEELTSMGIQCVNLIVQINNTNAIRLYDKYGFTKLQILENYYSFENPRDNTAQLMSKSLVSKKFWIFNVFKRITDKVFLRDNTQRY
jgi:ribosomal protein S18 acetylase RimI-like enzyme